MDNHSMVTLPASLTPTTFLPTAFHSVTSLMPFRLPTLTAPPALSSSSSLEMPPPPPEREPHATTMADMGQSNVAVGAMAVATTLAVAQATDEPPSPSRPRRLAMDDSQHSIVTEALV